MNRCKIFAPFAIRCAWLRFHCPKLHLQHMAFSLTELHVKQPTAFLGGHRDRHQLFTDPTPYRSHSSLLGSGRRFFMPEDALDACDDKSAMHSRPPLYLSVPKEHVAWFRQI